jgi:MFS family permease
MMGRYRRRQPEILAVPGLLPFAAGSLISAMGDGQLMAGGVIFFVRNLGLTVGQVGFGLSIGSAVGLLVAVPMGRLADRRGPQRVLTAVLLAQALVLPLYLFVHNLLTFVVVVTLVSLGTASAAAARGALIAALSDGRPDKCVEIRAFLRSIYLVGVAVGTVVGGLLVGVGSNAAFVVMIVGDALTFAISAILMRSTKLIVTVPTTEPAHRAAALRDGPYLLVAALSGVMSLQYQVLTVALPIWILVNTRIPRGVIGPLLFVNLALVTVLLTKLSAKVHEPARAARVIRRAGLMFVGSSLLFAAASAGPSKVAIAVLCLAVIAQTFGELWQSAGGFGVSYGLALEHRQGEYQAVFGLGASLAAVAAPVLFVWLINTLGALGWVFLGLILCVPGLFMPSAVARASRRRPSATVKVPESAYLANVQLSPDPLTHQPMDR